MGWLERYNARRKRHPEGCGCGYCKRPGRELLEESRLAVPEPTRARPGSEEKIQVMRERFLNGRLLHAPGDASNLVPSSHLIDRFIVELDQINR